MGNKLSHKGFIGSVNFSTDDRVFYGKIEGINDLVTFEGTIVAELENVFRYIVDEQIHDCNPQ